MNNTASRLRDKLLTIQEILGEKDAFILPDEERKDIREKTNDILEKLDTMVQGLLVVGIAGGTGVGKSTLMNALAGSSISSASHRRPHTDAVLIYRHANISLPFVPETNIMWQEFIHKTDSVQQIILCDLPDFDSIKPEHKEQVTTFMDHIDILICLTSPEKYGDSSFYDFLEISQKSKNNLYFAINKSDQFFEGRAMEEGYNILRQIYTDFRNNLQKINILESVVYTLSAKESFEAAILSPWNQFPSLRQEIFRQRDAKEIKSIKYANLDVEYDKCIALFDKALENLDTLHGIVQTAIQDIKTEGAEERKFFQENVSAMAMKTLAQEFYSHIEDLSGLVGPSYGIAAIIQQFNKLKIINREKSEIEATEQITEKISGILYRHLDRFRNSVLVKIMKKNLPDYLKSHMNDILEPERHIDFLKKRVEKSLIDQFALQRNSSHLMYRCYQYVIYLVLALALIISLAGKSAWQNVFTAYEWTNVLDYFFTALFNLFTPLGLAALGSYMVISVVLGIRFYRRHQKRIERAVEKSVENFINIVGDLWSNTIDNIIEDLESYNEKITKRIKSLKRLERDVS